MKASLKTSMSVLALAAGLLAAVPAQADPVFDNLFGFGDSLNDTGNLAEIRGSNFPAPLFFQDSVGNGPPALDFLSQAVTGHNILPSLFENGFADTHGLGGTVAQGAGGVGTNYAIAGALANGNTSVNPFPDPSNPALHTALGDLNDQVSGFLKRPGATPGSADPNALYFVQIGGNDIRNAAIVGSTPGANPTQTAANQAAGQLFVSNAVAGIVDNIQRLINAGGKHFLVPNAGDVGAIPEFSEQSTHPGEALLASDDSKAFNTQLAVAIANLQAANPGVDIKLFDFFDFSNLIAQNAGLLGVTNFKDPCLKNNDAAPNPNCVVNGQIDFSQFLFWDFIHPTAEIQQAWGAGLLHAEGFTEPPALHLDVLAGDLPEPASMALFGAGVLGLAMLRRRRRA